MSEGCSLKGSARQCRLISERLARRKTWRVGEETSPRIIQTTLGSGLPLVSEVCEVGRKKWRKLAWGRLHTCPCASDKRANTMFVHTACERQLASRHALVQKSSNESLHSMAG